MDGRCCASRSQTRRTTNEDIIGIYAVRRVLGDVTDLICALSPASSSGRRLSKRERALRQAQGTLVQGGFQTNNQYAQQGTDGGAQYAASETESTASAGEEAVARQQHRARDHGNPGVGTDW